MVLIFSFNNEYGNAKIISTCITQLALALHHLITKKPIDPHVPHTQLHLINTSIYSEEFAGSILSKLSFVYFINLNCKS